jgi:RecA-family ATPase
MAQVYEYCATMPGFDKSNKNPARLSRLPGVMRGKEKQALIHWSAGAESFQTWSDSLQIDDGLPAIESYSDLEGKQIEEPAELIKGVLHKGSKMVIGSNSKGRKTMLLIDLALSIASGTDWLGYETVQGRVLYINLELQEFFFRKRRKRIADAKELTNSERFGPNFDSLTLRGYAGDATMLIPSFINKIGTRQYDAIIIDPTYKLMGANRDENATKDIASLLNEFEKLAVQTGAAVVFVSHFSKGNQAAKEAIDRISGSGVFARDPDTIMTLTAHEEPDAMIVDLTLRNFPPVEQYTVKWNGNWLFERVGLDPKRVKKTAGRSAQYSADQLLDVLGDQPMEDTEWRQACESQEGIKKDVFYKLRKELARDGKVYRSKLDQKWSKTARQIGRET